MQAGSAIAPVTPEATIGAECPFNFLIHPPHDRFAMTQSYLPKQLSGLLTQANLDRALTTVRQPMAIAAFVSLGIHGLVLGVLPMLSSSKADESEQPRTVKAVQLSPVEQLRLPQFSFPQYTLPVTGSQTKLTPPSTLFTQPTPAPQFNDSTPYNFPMIPPPPATVWNPPTFDPFASIFSGTRPGTREATNPKPTPSKSPSPPPASPSAGPPTPSPTSAATPEPTVPPRSDKLTKEQLAALLAQAQQTAKDRENYTPNAANTGLDESKKNSDQGLELARKRSQGNLKHNGWQPGKPIEDIYPKDACPFKVGGYTWVGALVKPDGQPDQLIILRSSGYPGLDNAALSHIKDYKFASGDQYQAIAFPFKFEYSKSACPSDTAKPPA